MHCRSGLASSPCSQQVLAPVDDPRLMPGLIPPAHITGFKLG